MTDFLIRLGLVIALVWAFWQICRTVKEIWKTDPDWIARGKK